jgi:hypothetical protein
VYSDVGKVSEVGLKTGGEIAEGAILDALSVCTKSRGKKKDDGLD